MSAPDDFEETMRRRPTWPNQADAPFTGCIAEAPDLGSLTPSMKAGVCLLAFCDLAPLPAFALPAAEPLCILLARTIINVALLTKEHENEKLGLYHFGVWVDDLDASEKQVVDAGGSYLAGRPTSPNSFYEAKYRDPNGVVFDLTHHGWAGTTVIVVMLTVVPVRWRHVWPLRVNQGRKVA